MKSQISVLEESRRLHALGFAIHWCRPRSKAPLHAKWTTGLRTSWEHLAREYKEGMNVGVRLGRASQVGERYLAVIDFDLKSGEEHHQEEMLARLEEIFPGLAGRAPLAASGRANGSGHLYVVTKTPACAARLAQSGDRVKVHMPSARPSKNEMATLTQEEIAAGYRIRPAWEISQMGEGQQVVLPPSVHPDSRKNYAWSKRVENVESLPEIEFLGKSKSEKTNSSTDATRKVLQDFKPVEVSVNELLSRGVSRKTIEILKTCEDSETGSTDRSALAFKVAISLVQAGMSDDEITSVLTDPPTYRLGTVGFDHRKTKSRKAAASWVMEYCVKKARDEHDLSREFDDVSQMTEQQIEQIDAADAAKSEKSWMRHLERTGQTGEGPPKNSHKNVLLILTHAVGTDVFRRNLFLKSNVYGRTVPWNEAKVGDEVRDVDLVNIVFWFVREWNFAPRDALVLQAVIEIASRNSFHPVQDYILRTEWDGVHRIDTWLKTYLGAIAKEPYLSAISRKVLCAMVARVFQPGVDFQCVLVLEGIQGVGKSSVVKILGGEWTLDAYLDLRNKDTVQSMFGKWVVELGELASLKHADLEMTKAFFSRPIDRIRVSHGKLAEDFPRQCIFIGTTNDDEYLKDATGERRFWPIKTKDTMYDLEGLKRDRDQLFAEAFVAWTADNEELRLNTEETVVAIEEQSSRKVTDFWEGKITEFFEENGHQEIWDKFTMKEVFSAMGPIPKDDPNQIDMKRAGGVLRNLGFTKKQFREGKTNKKYWIRGAKGSQDTRKT